jgi:hypothetical protein
MACAGAGAPAGEMAGPKTGRARLATAAVVFAFSANSTGGRLLFPQEGQPRAERGRSSWRATDNG